MSDDGDKILFLIYIAIITFGIYQIGTENQSLKTQLIGCHNLKNK